MLVNDTLFLVHWRSSSYMKPKSVPEASVMGKGKLVYSPRGNVLIIGQW